MASSVGVYDLQLPGTLHARPAAGIRADGRQFAAQAHVRLARREDVPHVVTLIQQQAEYHGVREKCVATQANLEAGLFDSAQPFLHGPAVLLLELSPSSFASLQAHGPNGAAHASPESSAEMGGAAARAAAPYPERKPAASSTNGHARAAESSAAKKLSATLCEGSGIAHKFMVPELIKDPNALAFRSAEGKIIAGFAMIFKKYISFQAKHGMYVEDLYVREGMRGYGFGTVLFKSVARLAMEQDCVAVEFRVVDWNKKALKLYESMGVKVSSEWQSCSLTGDNLTACGSSSSMFADLGKSPKLAVPQTLRSMGA